VATVRAAGPAAASPTVVPVLAAISFSHLLNDTIQSLLPAIYPILKANYQLSFSQVGLMTLTLQLTASLLQPLVGMYTDRRPMPYSLVGGMAFSLIGLLLLSIAGTLGAILIAAGLVGVGSSIFHPESSRVARMASGGRHGLAQSVFQVGGNLGSSLGPLLAAFVVGYFQETIDRVIALAVFLPVLIGQAANTGVQALAVSLRGMTLGDLRSGRESMLVTKEMLLGAFNGAFTGVTGGIAMFVFATMVKSPVAVMLGVIVFLATTISCLISGVVGAMVPLVLKKFGADPATASSIVVTTFTDVGCLAVFLGLASLLI